jgi:hypothetical protein
VKHRALDLLRKQRGLKLKRRWVPLDEVADRPVEPAWQSIWALLCSQKKCLDQMPPRQSEVLRLAYLRGLNDREIAVQRLRDRKIALQRLRKARRGHVPRGASGALDAHDHEEKARERRLAIEAARKAVNRERRAALECLRLMMMEAELVREECPAA